MTTGSTLVDETTVQPYYLDGAYQSTKLIGRYRSKTWSGGNSFSPKTRVLGKKRYYTTVNAAGRTVRKSFRERPVKRAGFLSPNSYEMSAVDALTTNMDYTIVRNGLGTQHITGASWDKEAASLALPTPQSFDANDQLKLVLKLKEKLRGSDFNMAVFLGEGAMAAKMIGDSAIKLATGMLRLKKGNVTGAIEAWSRSEPHRRRMINRLPSHLVGANARREVLERGSAAVLATQYGWLPLLSDIRSGAELLAHRLNVPFRSRYAVRIAYKADVNPAYTALGWADGHSVRSRQIVAYIAESESIPKLLGVLDPELVLWELTPLSFVADWALPIGDWLEARAFASGLTGTFVTTEVLRRSGNRLKGKTFVNGDISGYSSVASGNVVYRSINMTRTVSTSLDVPMPTVKPLAKVASWQHALNGISLLVQVFSGMKLK